MCHIARQYLCGHVITILSGKYLRLASSTAAAAVTCHRTVGNVSVGHEACSIAARQLACKLNVSLSEKSCTR